MDKADASETITAAKTSKAAAWLSSEIKTRARRGTSANGDQTIETNRKLRQTHSRRQAPACVDNREPYERTKSPDERVVKAMRKLSKQRRRNKACEV